MSYTALYRKYRPDTFDEVKGQEHIVTTIKNQIKYDRIGHAYLFCGTRGTGKTTVAKLLAKAVNCENPKDGSPCEECASCRAIQAGSSLNVVEIDAASNNGVDNIRQINDAVRYSPTEGKYLVYIIDEVHMLSSGAFNALLKTLEEPPAYVIFILATTESHKVLDTIKSRCQRFDFRRISQEVIAGRLSDLLKREGISATEEAVMYIASAADGSMRDSLSILDECISFNLGEELTYDKVLSTIGAVDIDVYVDITKALKSGDAEGILDAVNDIVSQGRDLTKFTEDFVWFFRNMLFIKLANGIESAIDITKENAERIKELGSDIGEHTLMRYIEELQELSQSIRYSGIKRVALEMGLIKLLRPDMGGDSGALKERLEILEHEIEDLKANGVAPGNVVSGSGNPDESSVSINQEKNSGQVETGTSKSAGNEVEVNNAAVQELEQKLARTELGDKIKEIKGRTTDEYVEEQVAAKKEEIRSRYGDAGYEDIERLAKVWRTGVIPKLSGLIQKQIKLFRVVPAERTEEGDEIPDVTLNLVADSDTTDSIAFDMVKTHVGDIEKAASDAIEKKVKIGVISMTTDEMVKTRTIYANIENFAPKIKFENIEIV